MRPTITAMTKAGPWFAKQLPKLWPLLLDGKTREQLLGVVDTLSSQSPAQRLRAQVELTAVIADRIASEAASEEDAARARAWSQRARNLELRLDMPIAGGLRERRSHLRGVRAQLAELQGEIDRHLSGPAGALPEDRG